MVAILDGYIDQSCKKMLHGTTKELEHSRHYKNDIKKACTQKYQAHKDIQEIL